MIALRKRWNALTLGTLVTVVFLASAGPVFAESDAQEVLVAVKSLFDIKVALGLYYEDHSAYPKGEYTSYDEFKKALTDRYGIPYMELPAELDEGGSFEFVSYSGDGESFVINVRAADSNGTIVSATPDRVIIR